MANMMQRGSRTLSDWLEKSAGRKCTYWRGNSRTKALDTVPSKFMHDVIDEEGFSTSMILYDFRVQVDKLNIDGALIEPKAGDLLIMDNGDVYEATPPGVSLPVWEFWDTDNHVFLIHAVRIARGESA